MSVGQLSSSVLEITRVVHFLLTYLLQLRSVELSYTLEAPCYCKNNEQKMSFYEQPHQILVVVIMDPHRRTTWPLSL